jgi:AAHS family 4-hydroxybenzoate transporter-like MFS transporter
MSGGDPFEREQGVLDVSDFLGRLTFGRFHTRLVLLCGLVTFLDGVDLGIIAYAAPYIRDAMQLSGQELGVVFSSATIGQIVGAVVCSYIADRIGRRPVILVCAVLAGLFTIAMGFAGTFEHLLAARFMGGLAIGGLLPVAWALNIEAMPGRGGRQWWRSSCSASLWAERSPRRLPISSRRCGAGSGFTSWPGLRPCWRRWC